MKQLAIANRLKSIFAFLEFFSLQISLLAQDTTRSSTEADFWSEVICVVHKV